MRSKWITHMGKQILYADYTNFKEADFDSLRGELLAVEAEICRKPENSVLSLTDVSGSVGTRQALDLFKKSAQIAKKHIRRQAVVGVTGVKKILFDAVVRVSGQNAKTFSDLEKAKDWLVTVD
jgi:hypothetical protein